MGLLDGKHALITGRGSGIGAAIALKLAGAGAEALADLARLNPQGRLVAPEEVAETVLWLCTPGAQPINGQAISVSGGEV